MMSLAYQEQAITEHSAEGRVKAVELSNTVCTQDIYIYTHKKYKMENKKLN